MIEEALSVRNGVLQPDNQVIYEQLFNFHYKDGANMVTVGGIFYSEEQKAAFSSKNLQDVFPFVKTGQDEYMIKAPCLTYREIRYLDSLLPGDISSINAQLKIPADDLQHYSETYRYFPNFADTEQ